VWLFQDLHETRLVGTELADLWYVSQINERRLSMKKTVLVLVVAVSTAASFAQAEVSVNVNVGVPAPRVVVSAPPPVLFDVAPHFIAPSRLGFYVGVDTPYDIIFLSDYYYLNYGNRWHRARHQNGPWVEIPYRQLPPGIRKHRIEQIRSYRDEEYRVYRDDREHYRGRHFRPDQERREELRDDRKSDKKEWKDERKRDKEELKDERRRDKEDRKEEKQDRKHDKHDRD
jgi:hypothetical protein